MREAGSVHVAQHARHVAHEEQAVRAQLGRDARFATDVGVDVEDLLRRVGAETREDRA